MIVRAGIFYDGTLRQPRRNVDVVIDGDRIAAVRDAGDETPDYTAACVTPGLVNAHVHLEMSGEPNSMSALALMTQNQRVLRAVENAQAALESGVTTIRDLGCSNGIAADVRDAINAGRIAGPRISTAGAVLCMTGGHGWFVGRAIDGPWDARKGVREQLAAGADCIKLIATGGVLTKGAVPGNAQLLPEELVAAVEEAHRHDMLVASHAIGTNGIKNALLAGVDSIEHGHMLDDEAIALFKSRNVYLVPTLSAPTCIMEHARAGSQPQFVVEKAQIVDEAMRKNIRRAYDKGVKIAGGSDAGTPFNHHWNYAYELELMRDLLGMTPQQALHASTAVAAELIGLHSGTLAPGEPADVLLLSRDIADDLGTLRRPDVVVKSGLTVVGRKASH